MRKRAQQFGVMAGIGAAALGLWLLIAGAGHRSPDPLPQRVFNNELPPPPDLDFSPRAAAETAMPDRSMATGEPPGALPGHRVWRAADSASLESLLEAAHEAGLEVRGVIPELGLVHVAGDAQTLNRLRPEEGEDFVFPVDLPWFPDEDRFLRQGLTPFGDRAIGFLGLEEVPENWGAGVLVAVLDTGISSHAAFSSADIRQMAWGENGLDGDVNGHGTAVSGLLIGRDAYARGIAPGATLLSLPVLNVEGQGDTFELARGIVEAVNQGARVINISAGSMGDSVALEQAVDHARAAGAVIVAAAGNEGSAQGRYPAAYPGVIGVTAIDAAGQPPPFANSGPSVNLAAPGFGVYSAWLDEAYASVSGSSAAAPFVAGTIAMLMSEQPGLSAMDAADLVLAYTHEAGPPGEDSTFGAGVLNLERLLRRDTPGVVDLAVVPPFIDLGSASDTDLPLYLSVQNRGTTTLNQVRLDFEVDGVTYTHRVSRLGPGESGGTQLPLEMERLLRTDGVPVEMRATHAGGSAAGAGENEHVNNARLSTIIRLSPPPAGE